MDFKKPKHVTEEVWLQLLHQMETMGKLVNESYAEHLARVVQDADHNKDLLQAHYRALHDSDDSH